jgi:uncharacterized protein (DUF302 family)
MSASSQGLITVASAHSVADSLDRLEARLRTLGITSFARIDHAAGAAAAGLELRPTQLLVFGNARAGTPLMQADQRAGLDLPLKVLAWQDSAGRVWLTYNDPRWIAERHGLGEPLAPAVAKLGEALTGLVAVAAH